MTNTWREYNIYDERNLDDENDLIDDEDYASSFNLFDEIQEGKEEMLGFSFPLRGEEKNCQDQAIQIALKGFRDYSQSTGMAVWLGSEVLSHFLVQNSNLVRNKSVLEVGAGLGLAGIVSHHLDAKVTLTDGDTLVLKDYLSYNAKRNQKGPEIACDQLIWGTQGQPEESNPLTLFREKHGSFDVILAADCVYMPQSVQPFWQTIDALANQDNGCLIYVMEASSQAPPGKIFELARHFKFVWSSMEVSIPSDNDAIPDSTTPQRHEVLIFQRQNGR